MIFPRMSLDSKLVSVQYREYENRLFVLKWYLIAVYFHHKSPAPSAAFTKATVAHVTINRDFPNIWHRQLVGFVVLGAVKSQEKTDLTSVKNNGGR